jgi:predicted  nucleic acid-binding Zn-ribbon protein
MQSFPSLHSLILSLVTFGLSSGLTWLLTKNLFIGIAIGILTVILSTFGALITIRKYRQYEKSHRNSLRNQIYQLEAEENQLYQYLYETRRTQEQLEASITALNQECRQLIERVSELHQQRNTLYQETLNLQHQKEQEEASFHRIQNQTKVVEKSKTEIKHSLELTKTQLQKLKTQVDSLQIEAERLQLQIVDRKEQYEKVKEDVTFLEQEKQDQEQAIANLEQDIDNLLQRRSQLNTEIKIQTETPSNGVIAVDTKNTPRHLDDIISISMVLPPEWQEWLQFAQQLTPEDRTIFKAILDQDAVTFKQLADGRATMPQVLVESLNENALKVVGDTLFVTGDNTLIPQVHEEYAHLFLNSIELKFKDLLQLHENRE